jgi:hypothetical protein
VWLRLGIIEPETRKLKIVILLHRNLISIIRQKCIMPSSISVHSFHERFRFQRYKGVAQLANKRSTCHQKDITVIEKKSYFPRLSNASRLTWGIASLRQQRNLPQDTSLRERVEKSFWTTLA